MASFIIPDAIDSPAHPPGGTRRAHPNSISRARTKIFENFSMDMSGPVLRMLPMSAAASDNPVNELPLGLALTDFEKSGVFRAAEKLAAWRGVSIADVFAVAPLAWAAKPTAGGRRAGAGRPARDWAKVTATRDVDGEVAGFSLLEIEFALVVEGAVAGAGATPEQLFATMMKRRTDIGEAAVQKLYDAYVDARKKPPKSAASQLIAQRSARRAARALAG